MKNNVIKVIVMIVFLFVILQGGDNMALTKPSTSTNNIQSLSDRPNQQDGLTPAQLKLKFDQYGIDNNEYLENLVDEIEAQFATKDEITTYRKLSPTGDFTGTWNGVTMTAAEPGLSSTFNALMRNGILNLYVDAVNGLDTNDGSINSPVKTINKAIQLCPAIVKGDAYNAIQINLAAGTYKENIQLIGFPMSMGTRIWFKGEVDVNEEPTVIIDCENSRTYALQAMNGVRLLCQDIKVINIPNNGFGAVLEKWCEGYFWNFHVLPYSGAIGVTGISGQANCRIYTRKINVQNCQFGVEAINSTILTMGYGGDTDTVINCTEANIALQECSTGHVDRVISTGSQFGIRLTHNSRANIGSCTIQNNTVAGIAAQYNSVAYINAGNAFSGNAKDYLLSGGGVRVDSDASVVNPVDSYNTLPTPSEKYRGCFAYVSGSAGQPDKIYTCLKDSLEGYAWVEVTRRNRPAARAYKSSAQVISAGTYTKVVYDTEVYDNSGNYDTSLSRFVVPESGIYSVTASLQWAGQIDGNRTIMKIYKNGNPINLLYDGSIGGAFGSASIGSAIMKLSQNDYIEIYAYTVNATNTVADAAASFIEVVKLTE